MKRPAPHDIRPQLEGAAAGKYAERPATDALDEDFVRRHQRAFAAWARFTDTDRANRGEPLTAPAEILTPLP